jgi:hypothetical protein
MTPSPQQPSDQVFSQSNALDSYLIVIEGPMDKTRRPRRPGIPYTAPDGPLLPLRRLEDQNQAEPPPK